MLKLYLKDCLSNWKANLFYNGAIWWIFLFCIQSILTNNAIHDKLTFIGVYSLMLVQNIFPCRLPKAMYLCPITAKGRRRFLLKAYLFKILFINGIVSGIIMFQGIKSHRISLSLTFGILFLLFSISTTATQVGIYVPKKYKNDVYQETVKRTLADLTGRGLAIAGFIFSFLGIMTFLFRDAGLMNNSFFWIWELGLILVAIVILIIYFSKHFTNFLYISANYEKIYLAFSDKE